MGRIRLLPECGKDFCEDCGDCLKCYGDGLCNGEDEMNEETIRPFSCGSQFADWQNRNCCRCKRYPEGAEYPACDISDAILDACFDVGKLSRTMAERMGYFDANDRAKLQFAYTWDCRERS